METYGTVTGSDGGGGGGTTGVVQNNNMNLSFTTADGAAVYKPVIQPSSAPATPTQAYQAGGSGNGSAVAASIATATTAGEQTKRKRGRPRKYPVDGTVTPRLAPPPQPRAEAALLSPAPLAVVAPTSGPGKKSRGRPRGSGNKIKQHGNRQHVAPLVSQGRHLIILACLIYAYRESLETQQVAQHANVALFHWSFGRLMIVNS